MGYPAAAGCPADVSHDERAVLHLGSLARTTWLLFLIAAQTLTACGAGNSWPIRREPGAVALSPLIPSLPFGLRCPPGTGRSADGPAASIALSGRENQTPHVRILVGQELVVHGPQVLSHSEDPRPSVEGIICVAKATRDTSQGTTTIFRGVAPGTTWVHAVQSNGGSSVAAVFGVCVQVGGGGIRPGDPATRNVCGTPA